MSMAPSRSYQESLTDETRLQGSAVSRLFLRNRRESTLRVAIIAASFAALVFLGSASIIAADHNEHHNPPGLEEDAPPGNDGECTHGNSDQECRPDPQPEKGKDCEAHGANFDGNEDHCLNLDPGDPNDPSDPNDPNDPSDPSDPSNPSDPSDPNDLDEGDEPTSVVLSSGPNLAVASQQPVSEVSPAVAAVLPAALPAAGQGPGNSGSYGWLPACIGLAMIGMGGVTALMARRQRS
jgi:hypothetical protein